MKSEEMKLQGRPAEESTRPVVTSPKVWIMLLTKNRGTVGAAKECLMLCRRDGIRLGFPLVLVGCLIDE